LKQQKDNNTRFKFNTRASGLKLGLHSYHRTKKEIEIGERESEKP